MSFELLALIIFLGSCGAALTILMKKIPVLAQLPEVEHPKKNWKGFFDARIKYLTDYLGTIRYEAVLQKILSRVCVLTLRAERKASRWLQALREKEKNKKIIKDDNYWDKFREKVGRKRGKKSSI